MPGVKRTRNSGPGDMATAAAAAPTATPSSPYVSMFEGFRTELDEHYDRRERIIKTSRDITALSKKIIFALQRTPDLPSSPLPPSVLSATTPLSTQINSLFAALAAEVYPQSDTDEGRQLNTPNLYRYHNQYSPGIQEFIESLSFAHYLQCQRLITPTEVAVALQVPTAPLRKSDSKPSDDQDTTQKTPAEPTPTLQIPLTDTDYVGGISDLVGEMMRFGITGVATKGVLPGEAVPNSDDDDHAMDLEQQTTSAARSILTDLRAIRSSFESLIIPARFTSGTGTTSGGGASRGGGGGGGAGGLPGTISSKMNVLKQSVEKVEYAAYGLVVRGSERPKGWVPELDNSGGGGLGGFDGGGGAEVVDVY